MSRIEELREAIVQLLFSEMEPLRPSHAKDWADFMTNEIFCILKEQGMVFRILVTNTYIGDNYTHYYDFEELSLEVDIPPKSSRTVKGQVISREKGKFETEEGK